MNERERTFQPDYEVDGPYEGGPWHVVAWAWLCAKRGAICIAVAFAAGFVGARAGWWL